MTLTLYHVFEYHINSSGQVYVVSEVVWSPHCIVEVISLHNGSEFERCQKLSGCHGTRPTECKRIGRPSGADSVYGGEVPQVEDRVERYTLFVMQGFAQIDLVLEGQSLPFLPFVHDQWR